jgi:hypothetical protein
VFSKNRERLLAGDVAQELVACVVEQARALTLLPGEQFTVDGTLIEAWDSHKSFQPKDESNKDGGNDSNANSRNDSNRSGGFRGHPRRNDTHRSFIDPEARCIASPRQESRLAFLGNVMMDHRHSIAVNTMLTEANGRAEREAALAMAKVLGHSPCGAEHLRPQQPHRPTNHSAQWLSAEPKESQARRTGL